MTDNVSYLDLGQDIPVERVLDAETARSCDRILLIGWKDDQLYFASSTGDSADIILSLELAKASILDELREQG